MIAQMFNLQCWVEGYDNMNITLVCKKILEDSGFTIISFQEHYFIPQGYTSLFLLAESHFAIHTFPEENRTYIEISSCNKEMYEKFVDSIMLKFKILRLNDKR
jgi:S-adenosylmethionine decarboxylase